VKSKIIVSFIINLFFCFLANASVCNSYLLNPNAIENSSNFPQTLSRILYPQGESEVVEFTAAFFKVLANHKVDDPFLGMLGPLLLSQEAQVVMSLDICSPLLI
jgi:hypothetical protein